MTRPTVAVAIVTSDRRHVLAACLESVRVQVEAPDELLVIDNGSSDGTAEFVRRHHPEARLIEFERNLGCAPARNLAAKSLESDWIFFVDDDSVLERGAVAALRDAALIDPASAVIAPSIVHVLPSGEERLADGGLARRVHTFSGQCAVRREAMLEVGLYPGFKYGAEEQDLGLRLLDRGYSIRFDPAVITWHSPGETVRDTDYEMRSKLVNHVAVRWKYLPLWLAFGVTVRAVVQNAYLAVRGGQLRGYLRALAALPGAILEALRDRRPVRPETIRLYRELSRDSARVAALSKREGRSS